MAELALILGVQAVVVGAVAGLNYSNSSYGWESPYAHGSDHEVSNEPPVHLPGKQAYLKETAAAVPLSDMDELSDRADDMPPDEEGFEFAYT